MKLFGLLLALQDSHLEMCVDFPFVLWKQIQRQGNTCLLMINVHYYIIIASQRRVVLGYQVDHIMAQALCVIHLRLARRGGLPEIPANRARHRLRVRLLVTLFYPNPTLVPSSLRPPAPSALGKHGNSLPFLLR
jgi:hypothetical protein